VRPENSFHFLLKETYPKLWRFCLARTGRYDTGADLAQATSLRALEKQSSFETGTRLDLWLYKMAHRLWLNDLRAQKIRRGQGIVAIDDANLKDTAPDAVTNIFGREVLDRVMSLPEAQRATVLLVYVEGFKYAQAAEILDIPVGTIMSRLSAARKTLAHALKDAKDGSG